ncbi:hypothetical protein PR202_ga26106 [Eleusine coracana subsp. coracana]|uniref:RRM domain-containing protein n=1 Tax=Eleusine coracana subsp. coracana TaxID=191504 RepID=A0AAV5DCU6_ELECO|nr:hypothetical protein PR202_ga26106 [Eleusine coracana subsp. coracana]
MCSASGHLRSVGSWLRSIGVCRAALLAILRFRIWSWSYAGLRPLRRLCSCSAVCTVARIVESRQPSIQPGRQGREEIMTMMAQQPQPLPLMPQPAGVFGDTTLTKVFVGGLAWETHKDTLREHFERYGDILEAVIISDKLTGRSKGYGFVTFKEAEAAKKACEDATPSSTAAVPTATWPPSAPSRAPTSRRSTPPPLAAGDPGARAPVPSPPARAR